MRLGSAALSAKATRTVLVVEDSGGVRRMLGKVFRRRGYRVLTAEDADEAFRTARREEGRIDVLLTDLVLPGMDGWELARTLRAERPEMAVVVVSGYRDREPSAEELLSLGATFLPKPFTADAVVDAVQETLASESRTG